MMGVLPRTRLLSHEDRPHCHSLFITRPVGGCGCSGGICSSISPHHFPGPWERWEVRLTQALHCLDFTPKCYQERPVATLECCGTQQPQIKGPQRDPRASESDAESSFSIVRPPCTRSSKTVGLYRH